MLDRKCTQKRKRKKTCGEALAVGEHKKVKHRFIFFFENVQFQKQLLVVTDVLLVGAGWCLCIARDQDL